MALFKHFIIPFACLLVCGLQSQGQTQFKSVPGAEVQLTDFFAFADTGETYLVNPFEYSDLITLGEYKAYLNDIKLDSSSAYFREQLPKPSNNDELVMTYLNDDEYDDYPVMGISWVAAMNYCVWRGNQDGKTYQLPTNTEWIALMINAGNYVDSKYAEWLLTSYDESVYDFAYKIVPDYTYNALPDDPPALKRKRFAGNSFHSCFNDPLSNWSRYGYQDSTYAHVGFRLVTPVEGERIVVDPLLLSNPHEKADLVETDHSRTEFPMENGMLNGTYRSYYLNGQLKTEGEFINNQRMGIWSAWNANGEMLIQREYFNSLNYSQLYPEPESAGPATLFDDFGNTDVNRNQGYITYDYLREQDVVYTKRLWRRILVENNQHIIGLETIFPELAEHTESTRITAYNPVDDQFKSPMHASGFMKLDPIGVEIIGYDIKEDWFFDWTRLISETRIIGLAPIYVNETGDTTQLVWYYHPALRGILASMPSEVDSAVVSISNIDDVFFWRHFISRIWKESNVYDRNLDESVDPLTIEQEMIDIEHDLWLWYNGR